MGMVVIYSLTQSETSHLPRFGINSRALVHPDLWPSGAVQQEGSIGLPWQSVCG